MARLKSIVLFIAALSSVAAQPPDTPELKRAPSTAPHLGAVWSLAFTPDSKILISAGADRTIRLWNVETGTLLRQIQGHADAVWSVAVAPRGRLLASAGEDGTVALWELASGQLVRRIDTRQGLIRSVAFSPD
ncbi:MAG TPA: hypothetical protein VGY58_11445, partial [Gemmataceae bacterium]|nr:hypothetical protein [Gemmataceae bacterium]